MKTNSPSNKFYAIALAILIVGGITGIILASPDYNDSTIQDEPLSAAEIENLQFIYEEEKLARDVYLFLYDEWGISVFSSIARSEQTHIDAVYALLSYYSLTDTIMQQGDGIFNNILLQDLYDSLTAWGQESIIDALEVGGTIEEIDILDLQDFIANTAQDNIASTYEMLMKGSRNHLRSFVSNLEQYGVTYEPLYMDQAAYDAIIGSSLEIGE